MALGKGDDWIGQYVDLETGEVEQSASVGGSSNQVRSITIEDASSVSAKVLVPQLGSDRNKLAQGEVDVRRFSNIDQIEVYWLNWFMNVPDSQGGQWSRAFCDNHLNLKYSVGGENKKLVVDMQQAISGLNKQEETPKKKGILERLGLRKGETE